MNNTLGKNISHVGWSTSSMTCDEDEREMKPLVESLPSTSYRSNDTTHIIHDFSIRGNKIKTYSTSEAMPSMEYNGELFTSRSTQKCGDSFAVQTCCGIKRWTADEVAKAISTERTFFRKSSIVIKFPDKKANKQVISKIHSSICAVNFLPSPFARRCLVTLKDPTKRAEILTALNSTQFGSGFLSADGNYEELIPALDDIDPFTLFLDNIPSETVKSDFINIFPSSQQISVGYTIKVDYTKRFAFIIYSTIKDAIDAFLKANTSSDVIVRFRRFSGSAHLPTESDIKKGQNSHSSYRKGLPIVTDNGPPIISLSTTNCTIVNNVPIKNEAMKRNHAIVLDDDDDANPSDDGNDSDFEMYCENLKRSRLQLSMLPQFD